MDIFKIKGGTPLKGAVEISGAKNAALPIFAACLLTQEPCRIENVPELSDIHFMAEILRALDVSVTQVDQNTWDIHAKKLAHRAPYELVRKMRASVCLMGPMVGRLRRAEVSLPGGCILGPRPIDLHLKGFSRLGCTYTLDSGYVHLDGTHLKGGTVFLGGRYGSTVTGTANVIMAAVLAPGTTCIESAAMEPELIDLCHMLNKMGAQIEGIGSPRLMIQGVDRLKGVTHRLIPDRIEAGTFLLAAPITGGSIEVKGVRQDHLGALIDKMEEVDIPLEWTAPDVLKVGPCEHALRPSEVVTLPYPGFPTDLQAQFTILMLKTPEISILTERVYPKRFMHVPELQRMGASITQEGASAIVRGTQLSGAPVMSSDLRASACLVLAGLMAEGETYVRRIYHIDRGYEQIDQKLRSLGAQIERLPQDYFPEDI